MEEGYQAELAYAIIPSRQMNVQAQGGGNHNKYLESDFSKKHLLLTWIHEVTKSRKKSKESLFSFCVCLFS
jgi:hypothetical protein